MNSFLEKAKRAFSDVLHMEAAGGIALMFAALIAIFIANSPLYFYYDHILHQVYFKIGFDDPLGILSYSLKKSLLHWINDGLMAIFFFLVGLEIKKEVFGGSLASPTQALLPVLAAIGGMIVPALIYWSINSNDPSNLRGWAIPAATDIAFALGVLSLLGSRVPIQLKILLTAIAVIDDLLAIIVIALFYTDGLDLIPLFLASLAIGGLLILNLRNVCHLTPYLLLTLLLWIAVLKSGIHATLAGALAGLFIPITCNRHNGHSPASVLEHALHPWVAFAILPLFAFANAGLPLNNISTDTFSNPLTLGIIAGLCLGKPIGIVSTVFLAVKSGLCPMIQNVTWMQIFALSLLCGIGFTMSLFIGTLAFADDAQQSSVRIGVLSGSVLSATAGYFIFKTTLQKPR